MKDNGYVKGSWWAHCDVCGFKYRSHQMRKRWDGLMVCDKDFEHDHPQKYLKVTEVSPSVPWVRHQSEDTFVDVCYLWETSAYAGLTTAGCAAAGVTTFPYDFLLNLKNAGVPQ